MLEKHEVYVYWDEHLKGHAFVYQKPSTKQVVVSDGVYDRQEDAENSAWLCCFADREQLDEVGFVKNNHCKTVSVH